MLTATLMRLQKKSAGLFIKGPIPVPAIAAAGALPGRALLVLLAVLHRIDLTGKPVVTLPPSTLACFGFDKDVRSRALRELESAGIIHAGRRKGRAVVIALAPGSGFPMEGES